MPLRRADRLFELLQLLRGGRLRTGRQLAEELGVSLRTVYRDIEAVVGAGVPIDGERGVGFLLREPYFLPPLTLTADELEALTLGVAMVRTHGDEDLAKAAGELLVKIDAVLPAARRSGAAKAPLAVFGAPLDRVHRAWLKTMRTAIKAREKLALAYRDAGDQLSERTVRPLELEHWGKVWTCTAWCELRQDFRMFRVDRVAECRATGERFADEPGRTLSDYEALMRATKPPHLD